MGIFEVGKGPEVLLETLQIPSAIECRTDLSPSPRGFWN